jgi:hypothetical protein
MKQLILALALLAALVAGCNADPLTTDTEISTVQNVAIYYADGALIDEDGEEFRGSWNLEPGVYFVTYDTKGTATRLDDEPIAFQYLGD